MSLSAIDTSSNNPSNTSTTPPVASLWLAGNPALADGRTEVAFVLDNVDGWQALAQSVRAGVEVVVLDSRGDALAQMADYLAHKAAASVDAVHVLSHGSAGAVQLGALTLTAAGVPAHAADLARIGAALQADGDLLLYGCNVAQGQAGADLIARLSQATGADLAASDNLTGAEALGGNWALEAAGTGVTSASLEFSSFSSVLETITFIEGSQEDADANNFNSFQRSIQGTTFTFKAGSTVTGMTGSFMDIQTDSSPAYQLPSGIGPGVYALSDRTAGSGTDFSISAGAGYTFDLTGFKSQGALATVTVYYVKNGVLNNKVFTPGAEVFATQSGITEFDDVTEVVITTDNYAVIQDLEISDVRAPGPVVTDSRITLTSTGSGTSGAYKIGDTVTAAWNNTAGGDNNSGVTGVTVDFSQFGGGAAVVATNSGGTWSASYTITSGSIDAANRNVSVSATAPSGTTTRVDSTNAVVDNQAPTVNDSRIAISGATGTGGAYKVGDTVTVTWNNTAGGDNNSDTITSARVDFSAFGGGSAVAATNSGGVWTAAYTITTGSVDTINRNVTVTATDNAGNATTTSDSTNATVDSIAPTVTDARIAIAGGSGPGGAYVAGDTITATWNNTAGGDNNSDTISSVAFDFSQFGGGSSVAATNSSGTWTATYLITAGSINATNRNVSASVTDNAGNNTTAADTTNATVNNVAPTVTDGRISIAGGSGPGGAYKIGDVVTATWNNTAGGDNNSGVTGVTVDFSQFGGGSTVTATNSSGTWTATYTIVAGSIDATGRNVSVSATAPSGTTTTADSTNATIDNLAPTVTAPNIGLTGGSGLGGAYKIGDTVTATWNNSGTGDNNVDTLSGVTVDFSQFGGGSAVAATNNSGIWSATYTITAGAIDATGRNVSFAATDNAGNPTTRAGTTNATVDSVTPTVTGTNIAVAGGSGAGGAYKAGDTVTATWNNTGTGDSNSDTMSAVTVDFSQFGGGSAVVATNAAGLWTATYTIAAGSISTSTAKVSVTAADNAGNSATQAGSTNATVDNGVPAVTGVTSTQATGSYKVSDTIAIQVSFGENVFVTDTPTLALDTGGTATYVSGSGTGTLTFTYTIAAGQNTADLDYASTSALSGGTIRDAAGNNAVLTLAAPGTAGSLGANKDIIVDTTAPTNGGSTIVFSQDTGTGAGANTDLVTSSAAQNLSGALTSGLAVGEQVQISLDNGGSWLNATAAEGDIGWTLAGQTLAGSNTLKVRLIDNAGNTGPEFGRNYTLDTTAPTANTAGGTPADNATSASTTGAIVLPFSEPLDVAGSVLTTVQLRDVATHTFVAATVTINGSGQLVITPAAALSPSVAYSVVWGAGALKDLAGNSVAAVADDTTYNFTTAAAPSSGGGGTPPGQTVDGTTVQTETTTNSDGSTTTTTTVAPVPANRPEDASTPNSQLADIPLAKVGGDTVLQIGLPVGVGVTSSETSGNNLGLREKLMGASQPLSSPADFAQLLQTGIDTFVPGVQDPSQVTVRTLTLSVTAGTVPGQPIVITGANGTGEGDGTHPLRQEALVIDARQLPSGTVLRFDKVEFALVIGAVRIVGGEGANFVVGDSAAQFIVLGAGDDVLRGGAGDDVVGSKGGNDRLYGDEGNDKLVGGIGNDHLEGGAGNDILVGGSSDAGTWRFALGGDGNLHASYASGEPDLSELTQAQITGNWQGGIAIDPRLAMVYNQDYAQLETTALLFQGLTGQLPTLQTQNGLSTPEWTKQALLQGAWNWYEGTLPANLGTADKAKTLITQTLGASMASAQNVGIAVDFLGQGGTWTQALDFLVHLPQVKNAITVQTAGGGSQLNLGQPGTIAETGWSFDSGNDTLLGGSDNDVLIGGGGSDTLDGGDGTDMAVYFGTLAQYSFILRTNATTGQQEILVRHVPSGDIDTLRSVELLQVGGQAYRISNPTTLQQGTEYTLAGHVDSVSATEVMLMGLPTV